MDLLAIEYAQRTQKMRFDEFATIFEGYREAQQEFAQGTDADAVKKMINAYRSLVDRNQVQGPERNIDHWRKQGWENFSKFVQSKNQERSSTQIKRNKGIKPQQITLQDDDSWLIVIPLDKDTSCFYGRGTSWCTTKSQDRQFEMFFYDSSIVLIYCIKKSTGGMWAIAYDEDDDAVELFDQNNNELSKNDFQSQTLLLPEMLIRKAFAARNKNTISTARLYWKAAKDKLSKMDFGQLSPEQKPEIEKLLLYVKDPYLMIQYAQKAIRGRWPPLEPMFVRNALYAYAYAKNVIHGRWPQAEPAIAIQPEYAYYYATDVIKGRFPAAEPVIATNQYWAQAYAQDVIHGPWPEAGIN